MHVVLNTAHTNSQQNTNNSIFWLAWKWYCALWCKFPPVVGPNAPEDRLLKRQWAVPQLSIIIIYKSTTLGGVWNFAERCINVGMHDVINTAHAHSQHYTNNSIFWFEQMMLYVTTLCKFTPLVRSNASEDRLLKRQLLDCVQCCIH